jgi:electron transfer flavoprotein beta subunit
MSRVRRMYVPEKGRATMIEGTLAEQAAKIIQIINEFKGA